MQSHTELRHGLDHSIGIPKFCVCESNRFGNVEMASLQHYKTCCVTIHWMEVGLRLPTTLNLLQSFRRC
jgi:hypothetical protein